MPSAGHRSATRAYSSQHGRAAVGALRDPQTAEQAASAVADLRYAVSDDRGDVYPTAVPATTLFWK